MDIETLIPSLRNSFRTEYSLEEIRRKFETAKREIGRGQMADSDFLLVRLRNRSAAYLVTGELRPSGSGFRISYQIHMHRVLQWVYLLALPLSAILFFQHETFTALLQLYFYPLWIRFAVHLLIISGGIWISHRIFRADMEKVDEILKTAFAAQSEIVQKR